MQEIDVEFLAKEQDRVLRLCKYACINKVYSEVSLADKAMELFFVTPKQSRDIAQMCLARLKQGVLL